MSNTKTNADSGFFQKNIWRGSKVVRVTANTLDGPFTARLFVNGGDSATEVVRKAKTLAGAERQASRILGG